MTQTIENDEPPGYRFRQFYIPGRMMEGFRRYFEHGIMPGHFLTAVLKNDLRAACERADDENLVNLPAYIAYLYNVAPHQAWGSPEKVEKWCLEFPFRFDNSDKEE